MIQLRYYARTLQHWSWLLLLSMLVCAGTTYAISRQLAPTYQASTLLQINSVNSSDSSGVFANQALAVSDALLVTSNDVLRQVAQQVQGENLARLQMDVSASPEDNTQIIQIRANADTPQKAMRVANAVAQTFIALQAQRATASLAALSNQLVHLLAAQKAQLDADTAQLTTLQSINASADQLDHQRAAVSNDQVDYSTTLTAYQQTQLKILQASNAITQVQAATAPDIPTGPRVLLNTLVAALLGLLIATTLALVLDWMNTTIKTPEDVKLATPLQPVGSIMLAKQQHTSLTALLLNANGNEHETTERDFIALSTSFYRLSAQNSQCAVVITGIRASVGVTTTAVHLARSLVEMGKRVLLIDANIRRPFLHTLFHCQNVKGLTNTYQLPEAYKVNAQLWLQQWATAIPNLWLLPTGPTLAHPQTMLRSQELSSLISWLLGHQSQAAPAAVDFILFDTPSLTTSADTLALASITSAILLVIEAGKERAETLHVIRALLQRMGTPILGVVVNRQTPRHHPSIYTHSPSQQQEEQLHTRAPATPTRLLKRPKVSSHISSLQAYNTTGSRLFSEEKEKFHALPDTFSTTIPPVQPMRTQVVSVSEPSQQLFKHGQFFRH